ncbi:hypothetical protein [Lactobacillus terrae]|uniref:hypothetical protein n=1 Tax=Lactobacillus terrae TaxID=2269374 RepID=UPI000C1B7604|nr:hypothetical protein [Lactobacillus terrae]
MNQAQLKAMKYGQAINDAIAVIEKQQDILNPEFEVIKKEVEAGTLAEMDEIEYEKIRKDFSAGTKEYKTVLQNLEDAKAPARMMGTHMSLVNSFRSYVEGCTEMTKSLGKGRKVNKKKFGESEATQDKYMDKFSYQIQKLTQNM